MGRAGLTNRQNIMKNVGNLFKTKELRLKNDVFSYEIIEARLIAALNPIKMDYHTIFYNIHKMESRKSKH